MPTFSRRLEQSLTVLGASATRGNHEYATLEQQAARADDGPGRAAVMRACKRRSRQVRRSLTSYRESELRNLVSDAHEV